MEADENGEEYSDNGERAIFFARGVLETVKKLRWVPDIIHCQGWMSAVIPLYIKTAYHEEPSFANTKVITSLCSKELKNDLGERFKDCIVFKDAKRELLDAYKDPFDFAELSKLAIDYSDGVVEAGDKVNPELVQYAIDKGKPVMRYPGEENISEPYDQFYDEVYGDEIEG